MPAVLPRCWNRSPPSSAAGERMVKRSKTGVVEPTDAATAKIRALAREAGPEAIKELLRLSREADSESVQLAAIKEVLDRGFGRAGAAPGEGGAAPVLV